MSVPKHQILTFERSETALKTYILTNSRFKRFVSVRLETPYAQSMVNMGAKYILTGYDQNGNKTIFTGLFPKGNGTYTGDHYTPQRSKKRHLIIVKSTSTDFKMFYFNTYPKNIRRLISAV